jgi:hypothetical protein
VISDQLEELNKALHNGAKQEPMISAKSAMAGRVRPAASIATFSSFMHWMPGLT